MTGSSHFLTEDEIRYLRGLEERIAKLERLAQTEVPIGSTIGYRPPVRSAAWSDTRFDAVASNWNHWYLLNELEGPVQDQTGDPLFSGTLAADSAPALPLLGQIGGLSSDGGYSVYFAGKEKSRIDLPLLLESEFGWSMEAIFKPEVLPQTAYIFYNGNENSNGYGIGIGSGVLGTSGSKLIYRSPLGNLDTGITLIAGQWYDVIFVATEEELNWYVATINPLTKSFSISTGVEFFEVEPPTVRAVIGARGPSGTSPFKGWVAEVATHDSELSASETLFSVYDRLRTALEPSSPFGFIKTDGINISRSKYARLFNRNGTKDGAGDGVNTFGIPNIANTLIRI